MSAQRESGAPDEARELLELAERMFAAIRTRDRGALEQLLCPEFELHVPGEAVVRRDDFISAVLAIPGELLAVDPDGLRARRVGEVGVVTGRQRATVRLPDGATVVDVQAFTDVARKENGRWRWVLAHSVPLAPG